MTTHATQRRAAARSNLRLLALLVEAEATALAAGVRCARTIEAIEQTQARLLDLIPYEEAH